MRECLVSVIVILCAFMYLVYDSCGSDGECCVYIHGLIKCLMIKFFKEPTRQGIS